jgi:hypothetical protein
MRSFLNSVLSFITRESLTDAEFNALPAGLQQVYDTASYNALKSVLVARGNADASVKKLQGFYQAKGVAISGNGNVASSQIFVGSPL